MQTVRFTPAQCKCEYGDESTAAVTVFGALWPTRKDEFNPTPTSHIYHQRAAFTITAAVDFAADYPFANGPWTHIAGTLRLQASDLQITVGTAKTVLVYENCNQNPRGPGC